MIVRRQRVALYAILVGVAGLFIFPFYWLLISSLKSPAGMTLVPPAFYPAEAETRNVAIPAAGRLIEAEGKQWFLLCRSADLLKDAGVAGGYFVQMDKGRPTQSIVWMPEPFPSANAPDRPELSIVFTGMPLHRVQGRKAPVAVAGRMVRPREGTYDELLFVVDDMDGADSVAGASRWVERSGKSGFEALRNPVHREVRRWAPRWKNYPETLRGPESTIGAHSQGFLLYMRNSFFISLLAVAGQIVTSSLVAFGFARLRFRGREALFILLLATLMVPAQVTLIPLFAIYKTLGWIDTFLPLIVPHFTAGAFNVFLMRQYMLTLPRELDESAAIDGCGPFRTWLSVILPNCLPVLIVVGLFTFVYTWQDVMGPLIYLDNPAYRTVTLGLEYFRSPYVDNRHLLMTGAALAMFPVAVVFLILQRHIMAGIATTGLKG